MLEHHRIHISTLVLLLCLSSNLHGQDFTTKFLISSYGISAGVDISTTQYGLGKNVIHESNPIQRYFTDKGPLWSGIAKSSMHSAIIWYLLSQRKEHPKRVILITSVLLTAQILVDYNNAKVISQFK